ncbi:transcriptional regulator [Microbacterium resistens]|uniref:LysR substrate-binding domain-containing protein n=2 Tax=Microbacterium resistens TaxID=156977 RepID=UPI001C57EDEC|nr:LysR substrate-binding domain-containing protein [Microbacterium resistens]MBW1639089.1 transcriptional regulator [Microbacterium resistens]
MTRKGAGGRRPRTGSPRPAAAGRSRAGVGSQGKRSAAPSRAARPAPPEQPRTFRLGAVPGAMPGRWIDTWKRRMPHVALELVEVPVAAQRDAVLSGRVDIALVREPLERTGLHAIPLYEELPVVVASADSHLLAADELTADDLRGEVLLTTREDVLGPLDLPTADAASGPLDTVADAVATVAAGVGIAVMPMSLARLHHRKDVDHRVLVDGPVAPVLLAWRQDATTPDVETFVGIVRGRTENSSR